MNLRYNVLHIVGSGPDRSVRIDNDGGELAFVGNVVITGGSGFLGRGILRRIWLKGWTKFCTPIVFSRDEYKQDLCRKRYPFAKYVLGDVQNFDRLLDVTKNADAIINTAAVKYVPEAEYNVQEAIGVNVDGTRNVIRAARWNNVQRVVFISTDKAVQPVNVYGATKMLGERLMGEAARGSVCDQDTKFTTTRYGNVVGSTGSVIPLFREQFASEGRVRVTDRSMTRFWLSIDEAVDLILIALHTKNGNMIVPKARALSIGEIADMITGSRELCDVIGKRPGEKVYEELIHLQESVRVEDVGHHYIVYPVDSSNIHEPFASNSKMPHGGWLTTQDLETMIEDATNV